MVLDACSLPEKMYIAIFCHLTIYQLSVASTVCKKWSIHALSLLYRRFNITSPSIWSHFIKYNLLQRYSSHCKELILFSIFITHEHESLLLDYTNDLIHLSLLKCHNLSDTFLYKLTKKHSNTLEIFTLWGPRTFESGVTTLTDKLLEPCLPNLFNVNNLSICSANISDQFLLLLTSILSNNNININININHDNNNLIINNHSNNININCNNNNNNISSLINLDLTECWKITAFGVAELFSPNHLNSLKKIKLQYHEESTIDVEFFEFISTSFPNINFDFLVSKNYLRNKFLLKFNEIYKNLISLSNQNSNVSIEKRDNVWSDNEIVEKFINI